VRSEAFGAAELLNKLHNFNLTRSKSRRLCDFFLPQSPSSPSSVQRQYMHRGLVGLGLILSWLI
jgi:hypothetical protein